MKRVVFMVGIEGAPLRYRARLPAEALALLGIESVVRHYRDERLPSDLRDADALVVYRVPATVQVLDLLEDARRAGVPVVFDVDDLIFDPDIADEIPALRLLPPDEADLWMQGVQRYRTTLEHCDGYIGSTPMLVRHAEQVTGLPAALFENGVGLQLARHSDAAVRRARTPGPIRIGYFSGTTTHDDDWRSVEPAVVDVLTRHPDVELWLGGHLPTAPALEPFGERVRRLPFLPWWELPRTLRDLDVNLAPLEPEGRFNEAKSAIKWLEAALCATVTIATPTEPFRRAIEHGVNGLLATTGDEWIDALDRAIGDDLLRARLGNRARRDALLQWSPHRQAHRYVDILLGARAWHEQRGARPASGWRDVVLDEPMLAIDIETYAAGTEPPPAADAARPAPPPARLARLRRSLAEHGVVETSRRVARRIARRLRRTAPR